MSQATDDRPDHAEFDAAFTEFVTDLRCDLLDLVIDTTMRGGTIKPFLSLWAFEVEPDALAAAVAKARAHSDLGFIEDVVNEVKSATPGIPLAPWYPTWPEHIDAGDRVIKARLRELLDRYPQVPTVWLRHVGSFEIDVLRSTGSGAGP